MAVDQWDEMIMAAARRYNVDPNLVRAIMKQESGGNPRAVSNQGARGLMQLMPNTAYNLAADPDNPAQNIDGAVALLSQLLDSYGDPGLAVLAYHGGPNRRQWGPKTQNYLRAVTSHYSQLSRGGSPQPQGQAPIGDTGVNATSPAPDYSTPGGAREFLGRDEPAETPAAQSTDDFLRGEEPRRPPQATTAFGRLSEGVGRGVRDVLDPPAEFIAGAAERTGLTRALQNSPLGRFVENNLEVPIPSAEATAAANRTERERFNQAYGDSGWASTGRIGGQVLASAPILATGSNVLSTIGNAARIAPATSGVANTVAPVAQTMFGTPGATTGSMVGNALARAAGGAVSGTAAAGLTLDPNRPIREQIQQGAVIGAGVNALVAPLVGVGVNAARGAFRHNINPERIRLANAAENLGVPVYGPQISQSPFIRTANNLLEVLPFSGQPGRLAEQGEQFTRAVSRTFGEDTPLITQQTIAQARRRIGGMLDDAATRTQLQTGNPQVLRQLMQLRDDALEAPLETNQHQQMLRYIDRLITELAPGQPNIPGDAYQRWTRSTSPLGAMRESDNPTMRAFGNRIREVLDDLLEQSSPQGQRGVIQDARRQWKALMVIQPLAAQTPNGALDPARLLNAVRKGYSGFDTGAGTGNAMGDLAQIGRLFMQRVHGSDTGRNNMVSRVLGAAEGAIPMAAYAHDPSLLVYGMIPPAVLTAGGRMAGDYLNSPGYRNRLMQSALSQPMPRNPLGTNVPLGQLGVPAAVATDNVADETAWNMPDVTVTAPR